MRARCLACLALLVPSLLAAQSGRARRPPRAGRPPAPAPKPPLAPAIHDPRLFYEASRFSFETYPLVAVVHTDRYVGDGIPSTWSAVGAGSRIDWRFKPMFSLTADVTQAMLGGPYALLAVDIGGRFRPRLDSGTIRPYVDARTSWAYTYDSYARLSDLNIMVAPPSQSSQGRTTSDGLGALVGAGIETNISRSLALTTGMSVARYYMYRVRMGGDRLSSQWNFQTTAVRFTAGLKYNPHRLISR